MLTLSCWTKRLDRPGKDRVAYAEHPGSKLCCTICGGKPCLRVVAKTGYCEAHINEAFQAAKKAMAAS